MLDEYLTDLWAESCCISQISYLSLGLGLAALCLREGQRGGQLFIGRAYIQFFLSNHLLEKETVY